MVGETIRSGEWWRGALCERIDILETHCAPTSFPETDVEGGFFTLLAASPTVYLFEQLMI